MESRPEAYDNKVLLENLQRAFRDWKRIESMTIDQGSIMSNKIISVGMRESEGCLFNPLKEGKERGLSLSREELINSILYTEVPRKR